MLITIRRNVFETNSSAVHSLVISDEGMEPSNLPMDDDGYILVKFGSFGKDRRIFTSQEDKLSYLITQCYYLNHWDEDIYDNYHFRNVEDAICEYTGAKGIKIIGGEPEIDHQELPEYELKFVDEYNPSSIQSFVFNKYVALETRCD